MSASTDSRDVVPLPDPGQPAGRALRRVRWSVVVLGVLLLSGPAHRPAQASPLPPQAAPASFTCDPASPGRIVLGKGAIVDVGDGDDWVVAGPDSVVVLGDGDDLADLGGLAGVQVWAGGGANVVQGVGADSVVVTAGDDMVDTVIGVDAGTSHVYADPEDVVVGVGHVHIGQSPPSPPARLERPDCLEASEVDLGVVPPLAQAAVPPPDANEGLVPDVLQDPERFERVPTPANVVRGVPGTQVNAVRLFGGFFAGATLLGLLALTLRRRARHAPS